MVTQKFPLVVWQDGAGLFTAQSLYDDEASATDTTAAGPVKQIKQYLEWRCNGDDPIYIEELLDPKLSHLKVDVRSEYTTDEGAFPAEQLTSLRVAYVIGRRRDESLFCCLPLHGVRFHCYSRGAVERLVAHYVGQSLSALTPRELSRFLLPESLRLDSVNVKARDHDRRAGHVSLPQLEIVAEPLGGSAMRKPLWQAWCRDSAVADLVERLRHDRASVLLVGEKGVGKTTVLANAVRLLEQADANPRGSGDDDDRPRVKHRFWMTSGARIIAGMQFLGEWEERCEALVDELSEIQGALCVSNLLGLIQAGGSESRASSVASFLVPYLECGELQVVAEATPRELDACRRLMPGLEALFQIVRIDQFEPHQAREVLGKIANTSKQNHHLDIAPGVVDVVYRLFRRFLPYQPFPGRCANFLRDLFDSRASSGSTSVEQVHAVDCFARQTGLSERFLRDDLVLDPNTVREHFKQRVDGQQEACEAMLGLVTTFKAGLNAPQRPLGTFLFCGPTGVGKTEMAKAIADYLFGSSDATKQLVRLDMSEYSGFGAAQRLTLSNDDTPSELIKRLRAQPFAVVLLDEIEKADAEVFDMLLGVLDEGRLTDRYGRTTVFCSSVIIMTSNLGADAAPPLGFDPAATPPYASEIMAFFRPEFVNRIDRLVTFESLNRQTILEISRKELRELERRDGMVRAGLKLTWDSTVEEIVANKGFDPRYGARPLQRTIAREIVGPLANWLTVNPQLRDATLRLEVDEGGRVVVDVTAI